MVHLFQSGDRFLRIDRRDGKAFVVFERNGLIEGSEPYVAADPRPCGKAVGVFIVTLSVAIGVLIDRRSQLDKIVYGPCAFIHRTVQGFGCDAVFLRDRYAEEDRIGREKG